jgi:hypothetical protein
VELGGGQQVGREEPLLLRDHQQHQLVARLRLPQELCVCVCVMCVCVVLRLMNVVSCCVSRVPLLC